MDTDSFVKLLTKITNESRNLKEIKEKLTEELGADYKLPTNNISYLLRKYGVESPSRTKNMQFSKSEMTDMLSKSKSISELVRKLNDKYELTGTNKEVSTSSVRKQLSDYGLLQHKFRFTVTKDELANLLNKYKSSKAIAEVYGISYQSVNFQMRKYGLSIEREDVFTLYSRRKPTA